MNLTPKDLTRALGTGLFALFLSYGIGITYAAWTAPTVTPPNGNVMAPINTGDTTQFKNGALVVNASTTGPNKAFGLQVWEPTFLMGTTSIGSSIASAGLLLDVEGKVGATQYCDQDGNNCTTAGDVHNGSTGPIDASRLPFKKGDLLAPGDRSLVSGLAQYTTDYFNIGTLGISGTNASNVKAGVTFGPGGGITGTMTSGASVYTFGSHTTETGGTVTCCPFSYGGSCTTVVGFPTASCPADKPYGSGYFNVFRIHISCTAGYTAAVYPSYTTCYSFEPNGTRLNWINLDASGNAVGGVTNGICSSNSASPFDGVADANTTMCVK